MLQDSLGTFEALTSASDYSFSSAHNPIIHSKGLNIIRILEVFQNSDQTLDQSLSYLRYYTKNMYFCKGILSFIHLKN